MKNDEVISLGAFKLSTIEFTQTVVFLINQMPTLILKNKLPIQKLFGTNLEYDFFQNFECAYRPNLYLIISTK